jgi:hypothetical protein
MSTFNVDDDIFEKFCKKLKSINVNNEKVESNIYCMYKYRK